MAGPAEQQRLLSVEEYLSLERESPVKHECVRGMIYALAGVTGRHSQIVTNILWRLAAAAEKVPCRVHAAEVKLQVQNIYYYPDIMVACAGAPGGSYLEDAPCLVVQVTSPSTEATDRREKLMVYRQIPTLGCCLIVAQEERRVERHRRDERGRWHSVSMAGEGTVPIPCPEIELSLDEIYARVE